MKLDKYGDVIVSAEKEPLPKMPKIAFALLSVLQLALVGLNILVLVVDFINFYLCFATVPMYVFAYIHYTNGFNTNKEEFIIPKYILIVRIVSPIVYILTAIPAIFQLF